MASLLLYMAEHGPEEYSRIDIALEDGDTYFHGYNVAIRNYEATLIKKANEICPK